MYYKIQQNVTDSWLPETWLLLKKGVQLCSIVWLPQMVHYWPHLICNWQVITHYSPTVLFTYIAMFICVIGIIQQPNRCCMDSLDLMMVFWPLTFWLHCGSTLPCWPLSGATQRRWSLLLNLRDFSNMTTSGSNRRLKEGQILGYWANYLLGCEGLLIA